MFKETISVPAEVHVLVGQKEAEEVFNASEGDSVEFGPFVVHICLFSHTCLLPTAQHHLQIYHQAPEGNSPW